ncbi:MAG: DUF4442 domain-containing protein [Bacteroidota bacterium]
MKVSENILKWAMRLYPPLLFQRIWVKKIHKDFLGADVKINKSILTMNFGSAIFGGTIYSASDPFYAMLFGQILLHKGYKVSIWLQSASIRFLKPAKENLYYSIRVTAEMIQEVEKELNEKGVCIKSYPIEIYSKHGQLHAVAKNEIHIRNKTTTKK